MNAQSPSSAASRLTGALLAPVRYLAGIIDLPLRGLQKVTGLTGMASFFLLPNMAIFTIFVLLPLIMNVIYSMTGGTAIFLDSRTFVGAEQYSRLLDCGSYLDPNSVRRRPLLDCDLAIRRGSCCCRCRCCWSWRLSQLWSSTAS